MAAHALAAAAAALALLCADSASALPTRRLQQVREHARDPKALILARARQPSENASPPSPVPPPPPPQAGLPINSSLFGFPINSNIQGYSDVYADVCDIRALLDLTGSPLADFTAANAVYADGKNAVTAAGEVLKLKAWASANYAGEPYADVFTAAFGGDPAFMDAWVEALTAGTDPLFATPPERAAAELGVVHGSIQSGQFMHWIDRAAAQVTAGELDAAAGAPSSVDKAWGIWAGNERSVCALSGLAKLGTAAAEAPSVNTAVLAAFNALYNATAAGDGEAAARARQTVINEAIVLPETLLLLATAQRISDAASAGRPAATLQAAALAYFRTISPLIGADSESVRAITEALNVGGPPRADALAVIRATVAVWGDRFGIAPADLGRFATLLPNGSPRALAFKNAAQSSTQSRKTPAWKALLAPGYAQTRRSDKPWWSGEFATNRTIASVAITLPPAGAGFKAASVHDVNVRVGAVRPDAKHNPQDNNSLCAAKAGVLAAKPGATVTLTCARPLVGRFVTVQIRGKDKDVLRLGRVVPTGWQ